MGQQNLVPSIPRHLQLPSGLSQYNNRTQYIVPESIPETVPKCLKISTNLVHNFSCNTYSSTVSATTAVFAYMYGILKWYTQQQNFVSDA